jgi:hypothetical protein
VDNNTIALSCTAYWAEQFRHLELQGKWKEQNGESLDRY